jgi:hypothetical protein
LVSGNFKAIKSCEQSGNNPDYHFARAHKPIVGGKGAIQKVVDYHLSRFACYLIAQNGDPRKPEIANAQKYFAIQTRRQEISDVLAADVERLELRKQTSEEFRALSGAARIDYIIPSGMADARRPTFDKIYPPLADELRNRQDGLRHLDRMT